MARSAHTALVFILLAALALDACASMGQGTASGARGPRYPQDCEEIAAAVTRNEDEIRHYLAGTSAEAPVNGNGVNAQNVVPLIVPLYLGNIDPVDMLSLYTLRRRNERLRGAAAIKGCTLAPPTVVFEDELLAGAI